MDSSTVENFGGVVLMREGRKGSEDEDDPWLESIKEQQEEMEKEKARKQIDSDEEYDSSENEELKSENDDENFTVPAPVKIDIEELISLKKEL